MAADVFWWIYPETVLLTVMICVLDRQRQKIVFAAQVDVAHLLADPGRVLSHRDLFDAQRAILVLQHQVEKTDYVRPQNFAGNAHSANLVWRDGGIGAGFQQSLGEFLVDAARDDAQMSISLARKHGDNQVLFIARERGDEALRAIDAELLEDLGVGGVADDVQHFAMQSFSGFDNALDVFLIAIDDDIRTVRFFEFADGMASGVAESADNVMVFELTDSLEHLTSPEDVGDLAFDEKRRDRREHIHRDHHSKDDHEHIEYTQRGIVRRVDNFAVSDARQRDYGHVQRVKNMDGRAAQDAISENASHQHYGEDEKCKTNLATEFHLGPIRWEKLLNLTTL